MSGVYIESSSILSVTVKHLFLASSILISLNELLQFCTYIDFRKLIAGMSESCESIIILCIIIPELIILAISAPFKLQTYAIDLREAFPRHSFLRFYSRVHYKTLFLNRSSDSTIPSRASIVCLPDHRRSKKSSLLPRFSVRGLTSTPHSRELVSSLLCILLFSVDFYVFRLMGSHAAPNFYIYCMSVN